MPNYTKTCSFPYAHYTETQKVVEKFVKNLFYGEKHSFIEWTYVVGNSIVYQQHILLKLRKPILKYTLNKYQVHWLSSFKHLKLPISIKIPVTIWQIVYMLLHDSYITKFCLNNILFLYIHTIFNNLHNQWARLKAYTSHFLNSVQ